MAESQPNEVALAAAALYGRPPEPEEWSDLLDFMATSWVDAEGLTLAARLPNAPADLLSWPHEVLDALWVVDGWDDSLVLLRDIATEAEVAVLAPQARAELPRRTVLRARVVPWQGANVFFGEPALYGEQGVIGRQQLLAQWRASPEPETIERTRALRLGFAEQHDQYQAFVEYFGGDQLTGTADGLESKLNTFLEHYLFRAALSRLGHRTHAEFFSASTGKVAKRVELHLGNTLREGGEVSVVFDRVFGLHFLPSFTQLRMHLLNEASHPAVLDLYLSEPQLPAFALWRAAPWSAIAKHLGVSETEIKGELAKRKPASRASPSVFPGLEAD